MILHNKVVTTLDDIEIMERVIRSGQLSQGPEVERLEEEFCAYTGRKYAVAVGSGTAAVRLALLCRRDLLPTVPAYSCVALANAAYSFSDKLGITDVITGDWTLDIQDLPKPSGSAVIVVNTFGAKATLPKEAGLIIEDCTHGFGDHQSDIEVLSLHATKLIGGAAGGMILTDRKDYADQARDRRDYDDKPASGTRLNDKMSDVHAALVRSKFVRLAYLLAEREALAMEYFSGLAVFHDAGLLQMPRRDRGRTWYRFVVQVKRPNAVMEALFQRGVTTERPVEWWAERPDPYPVARYAYENLISLPLYPGLMKEEVAHVCKALGEVLI